MKPAVFIALALGTVSYRVAVVANSTPESMPITLLMTGLGSVFLIAAVVVWLKRPFAHNTFAILFLLATALHWGGYLAPEAVQILSIVLYLLLSGVFATWALLLFALKEKGISDQRWRLGIAVLPVMCVLAGGVTILETEAINIFFLLHTLQSDLYALASLVILLVAPTRPGRISGYGMAVAYGGYLVVLLVDATAGIEIATYGAEPLNVIFAAIAVGFAMASFSEKNVCSPERLRSSPAMRTTRMRTERL